MTHSFGNHSVKDLSKRIGLPTLMGKASGARSALTRRFASNGTRAAGASTMPRAGALALGAAAMYWLDPANGRARRARTVGQLRAAWNAGCDLADKKSRDLRNRAQGTLAEITALFRADHATDDVVQARVRAELGTIASRPSAIGVRADRGKLELTGSIDPAEHGRMIAGVRRVRGVREVVDRLELTRGV